jgi:hypothetical protein
VLFSAVTLDVVYLAVMEGVVLVSAAEVVASLVVVQDVVMVLYNVTDPLSD